VSFPGQLPRMGMYRDPGRVKLPVRPIGQRIAQAGERLIPCLARVARGLRSLALLKGADHRRASEGR
jgi:hypothetical protein